MHLNALVVLKAACKVLDDAPLNKLLLRMIRDHSSCLTNYILTRFLLVARQDRSEGRVHL